MWLLFRLGPRTMFTMSVCLQHCHDGSLPRENIHSAAGPAVIHAGGREALTWLIDSGFTQVFFCGNALAAHEDGS